jgi:hypothetical protein
MNGWVICLFVVVFMIIVPVGVAFGLWFKDRKDEERKGYWDPE